MTLAAFFSLWAIQLAGAMSPGPAFAMSVRTAASDGFGAAVGLALGLGLGVVLWTLVAMTGLAALFHLAPWVLTGFKIVGAAYLIWIAIQMWRHAPEPLPAPVADPARRRAGSTVWTGFLTNATNPKSAVFFAAVFVGLLPPDTALWQRVAVIVVFFADEFLWNVVVARLFSLGPARNAYVRLKTGVDRAFGAVIGFLGLKIALT